MRATTTRSATGRNRVCSNTCCSAALSGHSADAAVQPAARWRCWCTTTSCSATPAPATCFEAFGNGLRFDLRVVVFALAPLLLAMGSRRLMAARTWQLAWLRRQRPA